MNDCDVAWSVERGGKSGKLMIAPGKTSGGANRVGGDDRPRSAPVRTGDRRIVALLGNGVADDFLHEGPVVADRNEIPVGQPGEKAGRFAFDDAQQYQAALPIERIAGDSVLPFGRAVIAEQILGGKQADDASASGQ